MNHLVVICLKTTTFVVSTTATIKKQSHGNSCDLLENYYLCSINNSFRGSDTLRPCVVICLKTTTFVVSTTAAGLNKEIWLPL